MKKELHFRDILNSISYKSKTDIERAEWLIKKRMKKYIGMKLGIFNKVKM